MSWIAETVIQIALLYAGLKLFFWARRQASANRQKWRRRVGLVFFLAPMLLWLLSKLGLPDELMLPVHGVVWANQQLDRALQLLLGLARENLDGIWVVVAKPLCYAVVYGAAGIIVGWPLDRLRAAREPARETAAAVDEAVAATPGADDSSSSRNPLA